jgi:hypothetical protein
VNYSWRNANGHRHRQWVRALRGSRSARVSEELRQFLPGEASQSYTNSVRTNDRSKLVDAPDELTLGTLTVKLDNVGLLVPGLKLMYDDGRTGHQGITAEVIQVLTDRMIVQFEDRAEATVIRYTDRAWMDYLKLA